MFFTLTSDSFQGIPKGKRIFFFNEREENIMKNKSNFKGCFWLGAWRGELGLVFKAEIMGKLKLRATWVTSWARDCTSLCFMHWVQMCCHHAHDESHLRKVSSGCSAAAELLRGAPGPQQREAYSTNMLNWLNLKWQNKIKCQWDWTLLAFLT